MLARLIVHDAIDSVLAAGGHDDGVVHVVATEVIDAVHGATRSEIEASTPSEPLDTFVQNVVATAANQITQSKRFRGENTLLPAAVAMRERAATVSCATCAGDETPCDGVNASRDIAIVARSGACIKPFREMFETAIDIVRAHYVFALGLPVLEKWPQKTTFMTFFPAGDKDVHAYASSTQIAGAADRDGADALIELRFCPAKFTGAAYLAAGYVLVHEALHLMEGIDAGGKRKAGRDEDPFVEGWMDWIAFRIFEDTLSDQGVAGGPRLRIPNAAAQIERGRELHLSRYNTDKSSSKSLAYRLLSGKRAAERLHNFCRRHLDPGEAWRLFLAISFLLNAKDLRIHAHRKLVERVLEKVLPGGPLRKEADADGKALSRLIEANDEVGVVTWLLR